MKYLCLLLVLTSGCATVNYYYNGKQCRQTGGSFVNNEVYLACPLYDKNKK